jgi:hypothetical protein
MTIPAQRLHPACDDISDFGQCPESGLDEMDAMAIIRSARGACRTPSANTSYSQITAVLLQP